MRKMPTCIKKNRAPYLQKPETSWKPSHQKPNAFAVKTEHRHTEKDTAGRDTVRSPLSGSDLEFSKKGHRESRRGQRKGGPLAFLIFSAKKGKSVSGQRSRRRGRRHGCVARWSLTGPHRGEALLGLRSSLVIFHLIDPGAPSLFSASCQAFVGT